METLCLILAAVGAILAAVFVWFTNLDAAFISAVLSVVAWLLSYRAKLKTNLPVANQQNNVNDVE